MDKLWRFFRLERRPGEAGDKVLEIQYRHLNKNIPRLYLVMLFSVLNCIYAVTVASSVLLRVILPVVIVSIILGRLLWWMRHRNDAFEPEKALRTLRGLLIVSAIFTMLCSLWSVLAWQWETSDFRFYIPAFIAMGAYSIGYCFSLTPRVAILNVLLAVMPISLLMLASGTISDFGLAGVMIATTLFLIGLIQRQHRNLVRTIDLQIAMHRMAHTDPLTGISNRRAFHDQLDAAIAQCSQDQPLTLVMIDLDRFKAINDLHGHLIGDRILQVAAQRLQDSAAQYGTVSRLGGDEFAILFEGQPAQFCSELMKVAIQKLREPVDVDGLPLKIGASYGLTSVNSGEGIGAEALILQTDDLLYEMKSKAREKTGRAGDKPSIASDTRAA